ncbi:hypothetical protein F2Q69_00022298 [Brassica cretica]|uniref:Glutamyl-tRNA reductase N-terminal domain-containing protein n=1 Tax=Brassica cretica TaxID=69181 RepID=A0A8S9QM75_BRACR|nr:hypothetical protein F2Q69_00022298 [Brassica cretica]
MKCRSAVCFPSSIRVALTVRLLILRLLSGEYRVSFNSGKIGLDLLRIHGKNMLLSNPNDPSSSLTPSGLIRTRALPMNNEAAVLNTCNGMEIYVMPLSQHRGVKEVTKWMSKTSGIPVSEICQHRFPQTSGFPLWSFVL